LFKYEIDADGTVGRYKARLVAQGFSQQPGQDCDKMFCPIVRLVSIIIMQWQHQIK